MAVIRKGFSLDLQHHLLKQIMTINSHWKFKPAARLRSERVFESYSLFHLSSPPTDPLAPTMTSPSSPPELLWNSLRSPGPDEESTTAKPSSPHFISSGINENLIPIYCSTLAAVLIGLLAYIVFKRWGGGRGNEGDTEWKKERLVHHWYIYRHFYDFIFTDSWIDLQQLQ